MPLLVGGVGGLVTTPAISTWYTTLNKPWFTPPELGIWAYLDDLIHPNGLGVVLSMAIAQKYDT